MPTAEHPLLIVEETSSTNTFLKNLNQTESLQEGTTVIALAQSSGRGQTGTFWESEPGKNLTCSIIVYPCEIAVKQQFILSQIISLSIAEALSEEISSVTIKWPNDIYYKDRKICGILIENEIEGVQLRSSVIGFGLNINQTHFYSDAPNPVSLKQITGKNYDIYDWQKKIAPRFFSLYEKIKSGEHTTIATRYKEHLYRKTGFHLFSSGNETFRAKIADVEQNGFLVLETEGGEERRYAFKEVLFKQFL